MGSNRKWPKMKAASDASARHCCGRCWRDRRIVGSPSNCQPATKQRLRPFEGVDAAVHCGQVRAYPGAAGSKVPGAGRSLNSYQKGFEENVLEEGNLSIGLRRIQLTDAALGPSSSNGLRAN